jgi:hypothetical protein
MAKIIPTSQQKNNSNDTLEQCTFIVSFFGTMLWFFYWISNNPLPDGYQNEYLHVGNAYDLFGALVDLDIWHMRWYMYTGYWPWGFYAVPWLLLWLFGVSYSTLLFSNFVYVGLIGFSCYLVQHRCPSRLFFALILVTPSIFGTIVRYEPNLANIAWVALGCSALLRSESLTQKKWCILWGIALGCGLMTDRLSVMFFLIPAIVPLLFPFTKTKVQNLIWSVFVAVLLSAAYYREFFMRNLDELTSQVNTGEIDSTGILQQYENPVEFLYYILSIIDTQLGLVIGVTTLICLSLSLFQKRIRSDEWSLLCAIAFPIFFFTCIAKKQVYYTLPILWPLLYFVSFYRRTSSVIIPLGLLGLIGTLSNTTSFNYAWMPEKFVAPRHVLLKRPSYQDWNFDEIFLDLDLQTSQMLVFSSDQTFFEGFLLLKLRKFYQKPNNIRGLVLDPMGSREFLEDFDHFVWISNDETKAWPSKNDIEEELLLDHYDINKLPPVAQQWSKQNKNFELRKTVVYEECTLKIFERKKP